ncbi:MAG: hypothetical protein OEM05_17160, partial [Myxococcales bacterium]|nr:hypothetical protein [Myxococcales bacterium]
MLGVFAVPTALAYPTYTSCEPCHGGFRSSPYISPIDGANWGDDLHDVHRQTMLGSDCNTCHLGGFSPVSLGASAGGTGLEPIGCVGCHGRNEDMGGDGASPGRGAGLRQHHWIAGISTCVGCHSDSNPANWTPVGEDVLPPYYFTPDPSHPNKPTDPCSPAGEEDYAGDLDGLDNDGDDLWDTADPDCAPAAECGNGVIEAGEDCDDGNTQDGDCCDALCTFEPGGSSCENGLFCDG